MLQMLNLNVLIFVNRSILTISLDNINLLPPFYQFYFVLDSHNFFISIDISGICTRNHIADRLYFKQKNHYWSQLFWPLNLKFQSSLRSPLLCMSGTFFFHTLLNKATKHVTWLFICRCVCPLLACQPCFLFFFYIREMTYFSLVCCCLCLFYLNTSSTCLNNFVHFSCRFLNFVCFSMLVL